MFQFQVTIVTTLDLSESFIIVTLFDFVFYSIYIGVKKIENRFIFYYSLNIMECKDNSDKDSVWLLLKLSVYILINDVCLETSDFVLKQTIVPYN